MNPWFGALVGFWIGALVAGVLVHLEWYRQMLERRWGKK